MIPSSSSSSSFIFLPTLTALLCEPFKRRFTSLILSHPGYKADDLLCGLILTTHPLTILPPPPLNPLLSTPSFQSSPLNPLLSTLPLNPPFQPILSTHPFNPSSQHLLSTPSSQPLLSTPPPFNQSSQPRPLNPPSSQPLPLNPSSEPPVEAVDEPTTHCAEVWEASSISILTRLQEPPPPPPPPQTTTITITTRVISDYATPFQRHFSWNVPIKVSQSLVG